MSFAIQMRYNKGLQPHVVLLVNKAAIVATDIFFLGPRVVTYLKYKVQYRGYKTHIEIGCISVLCRCGSLRGVSLCRWLLIHVTAKAFTTPAILSIPMADSYLKSEVGKF